MAEDKTVREDTLHGSMFVLLKRYIEHTYDYSTWFNLLAAVGLQDSSYQMHEKYPTKDLYALVHAVAQMTKTPKYNILEQFGEFLVPDLLLIYRKHVQPQWRTYDMLLNTEATMHGSARKEDGSTDPPILLVTKKGSHQLMVDYHSKRRLAGVAVGIIKGIANYYQESDKVNVECLTGKEEERVQILVSFSQ
ncbi:MAG: hypothetical protein JWQ14_3286 [Adhaeribacter sp.]|nr:hypothetical protein [Adhaeribacter sp.]